MQAGRVTLVRKLVDMRVCSLQQLNMDFRHVPGLFSGIYYCFVPRMMGSSPELYNQRKQMHCELSQEQISSHTQYYYSSRRQ